MAQGEPMVGVIVVPDTLQIGNAIEELELVLECLSQSDLPRSYYALTAVVYPGVYASVAGNTNWPRCGPE